GRFPPHLRRQTDNDVVSFDAPPGSSTAFPRLPTLGSTVPRTMTPIDPRTSERRSRSASRKRQSPRDLRYARRLQTGHYPPPSTAPQHPPQTIATRSRARLRQQIWRLPARPSPSLRRRTPCAVLS